MAGKEKAASSAAPQVPASPITGALTSPGRSRWRPVLSLSLLLIVLAILGWYVAKHWQDFLILRNLGTGALVGVVVLDGLIYVWSAGMIHATVRPFAVRLDRKEGWMLAIITRFGNVLTPMRGGAVARAVYLNKLHGLSYPRFLAGMGGMVVSVVAVSVVGALAGFAYLYAATGQTMWEAAIVLSAAAAAVVLVAAVRPRMSETGSVVRRSLARLLNGWDALCRDRRAVAGLMAMNLMDILTMACIYAVLLADMGRAMPWGALIVIVSLSKITSIFQVTPGNVGVYEAALAIIGALVGRSPTDILAATITWRVLDVLVVLATGPLCSAALARKAGRSRPEA
jgi:uncharacterized membrane protein YbhN (UPF0104 family)